MPSAGLGITDPTTADIRLVLNRAGADYAICFFVLDNDNETDGDDGDPAGEEFQVKVALRIKGWDEYRMHCASSRGRFTSPIHTLAEPATS